MAKTIAKEQMDLASKMERLLENADFKEVFYEFRQKKYIERVNEVLINAIVEEDEESVRGAMLEMRRLKSIDWFIKQVLDYYEKGKQTLDQIYEEEE